MSLAVQAESHLEEPVVAHVGWAAVHHIDTGGVDSALEGSGNL